MVSEEEEGEVSSSVGWFSVMAWTEGHLEMSNGSGGHSFALGPLWYASESEGGSSGGRFE